MRLLVALGGNALVRDPTRVTLADQRAALAETAEHLAALRAEGVDVVLTHGNGPQVGLRLQRAEASDAFPDLLLDALDADTQGSLGYRIQQAVGNALRARGLDDRVATVVTQVVVSADDPGFRRPDKPIGRSYSELEARLKIAELGWAMAEQPGGHWRRVVASPRPLRIVEAWAIRALAEAGGVVIGCGGGGIPVVEAADGLRGIGAVIDKDRASALLAEEIACDRLLFATGVERLYLDYAKPTERALERVTAAEAARHLEEGQFPAGSMGPKIEAALAFLERGGRDVIVTSPAHIRPALAGEAGTRIVA